MEQEPVSLSLLNVVLEFMRIVKADLALGADDSSVSPSQYRILRRLRDGEATVSELAKWNAVTLPTATKILDVLVERGWVERWRSRADRRLVHVGLTPRGREVQADLEARAAGSVGAVLQDLDVASRNVVEEAVATVAAALAQCSQGGGRSAEDQQGRPAGG
ncbi:MAG: winged helix DNA-binding protein [Anaerolineae bacterium]|nr:winged helix DNA-binding protein [Anaerolineae bacterium]